MQELAVKLVVKKCAQVLIGIANTRHSVQGVEFKYANKRGVARA